MLRRACWLASPQKLGAPAVSLALQSLNGWKSVESVQRPALTKRFVFADFHAAWGFMNACVPFINAADHHPEWFNVYNRVDVTLTTHDCGGVSQKDIDLAAVMDAQAKQFQMDQK